MTVTDYWIEISQHGTRLGGGFILTRRYALTALHCIRGIAPEDEDLELLFASGEVARGRVYERSSDADLALIDIIKSRASTLLLPNADRAGRGDLWAAPYRPSAADPYLSGDVLNGAMTYRCEAGHNIEALQLGCSQHLGDYSGYSGGPVERDGSTKEAAVLGVLLEQYPDRQAIERSSDVLFAATIAEALRRFDSLNVNNLLKVLYDDEADGGGNSVKEINSQEVPSEAREELSESTCSTTGCCCIKCRIEAADSLLTSLSEWGERGVLDPPDVVLLKQRVAQRLIDSDWIDN